jgi:hypothetical protein
MPGIAASRRGQAGRAGLIAAMVCGLLAGQIAQRRSSADCPFRLIAWPRGLRNSTLCEVLPMWN